MLIVAILALAIADHRECMGNLWCIYRDLWGMYGEPMGIYGESMGKLWGVYGGPPDFQGISAWCDVMYMSRVRTHVMQ